LLEKLGFARERTQLEDASGKGPAEGAVYALPRSKWEEP
jgi:hypothetical protein